MNKPQPKKTFAQLKKERDFTKLMSQVNTILNYKINLFSKTGNKNGLVRHLEAGDFRFRLQPTYSDTFYHPQAFISIAEKYSYTYYITVEKNLDGIDAPVLNFYPDGDDEGNC